MKKLLVSTLAVVTLSTIGHADAGQLKPSDLKKEIKSYDAIVTKNIKYATVDRSDYGVLNKGKKITVVQRFQAYGYDFLVLKDRKVISLRDDSVKILKAVPGKYDLIKGPMKGEAKQSLEMVSKTAPHYKQYQQAAVNYSKQKYESDLFMDELIYVSTLISPLDINANNVGYPYFPDYEDWVKEKPMFKGKGMDLRSMCEKNNTKYKIDILSNKFYNDYFKTNNRAIHGFKKGDAPSKVTNQANTCFVIGTPAGPAHKVKDLAFVSRSEFSSTEKIKEIYVTPSKKITYAQAIKKFGKPTKTKFIGNARVEEQLIYDGPKTKGWKVIVGLDGKKGNVKYLYKVND